MMYVATSAPHHLACRLLLGPGEKIPHNVSTPFTNFFRNFVELTFNMNGYWLLSLLLEIHVKRPSCPSFVLTFFDHPSSLPIPDKDNRKKQNKYQWVHVLPIPKMTFQQNSKQQSRLLFHMFPTQ